MDGSEGITAIESTPSNLYNRIRNADLLKRSTVMESTQLDHFYGLIDDCVSRIVGYIAVLLSSVDKWNDGIIIVAIVGSCVSSVSIGVVVVAHIGMTWLLLEMRNECN